MHEEEQGNCEGRQPMKQERPPTRRRQQGCNDNHRNQDDGESVKECSYMLEQHDACLGSKEGETVPRSLLELYR